MTKHTIQIQHYWKGHVFSNKNKTKQQKKHTQQQNKNTRPGRHLFYNLPRRFDLQLNTVTPACSNYVYTLSCLLHVSQTKRHLVLRNCKVKL